MEPVGRDGKRYCRARRDFPANLAACPRNKCRATPVILIKVRHTPRTLDPNRDCLASIHRCRICVDRQTLGKGTQRVPARPPVKSTTASESTRRPCGDKGFIRGLPVNPATSAFAGCSHGSIGAPSCVIRPLFMTAVRSRMVMVPVCPCVTNSWLSPVSTASRYIPRASAP